MRAVAKLVEEAQKLPRKDRRVLISRLRRALAQEENAPRTRRKTEGARRTEGPYAALLKLAGEMHSRYADVSSDKYRHLADIYADNHDDE